MPLLPHWASGWVDPASFLSERREFVTATGAAVPAERSDEEGGRKALVPICRCLTLPLDDLHRGRPHGDGGTGVGQKADIVRKYG